MILGLTGTHIPFDRLISALDQISQKYNEDIVIQSGQSEFKSKHSEIFQFKPRHEIQRLIETAEIIISHGGAGAIREALKANKPLIIIPRLKQYNEHCNNHQLEITEHFSLKGALKMCTDTKDLWKLICEIRSKKIKFLKCSRTSTPHIKTILDHFISKVLEGKF